MKMLIVTKDTVLKGGTANSLLTILDNLPEEINDIYVLLPARGPIQKILSDRKITVLFMNYELAWTDKKGDFFYDLKKEWNNYRCAKKLAKMLVEKDIDIVYTNSGIVDVGAMASCMAGKRHIWHHREFIHYHFERKYILEWKERFLMQHSEKNISPSKALLRELQKRYQIKNGVVLYNKFSRDKYYIENHSILKEEKIRCIVTGMMYEKKHQLDAVVAACYAIKKYGISVELLLVGNGTDAYVKLLKNRIHMLGIGEYVSIKGYISDITVLRKEYDVEISCSQWESFGRNIIEAMLGGLLVIGANSGATKELIKPYKNGLLYEAGNAEDLAKQLAWIWRDRKRSEKIAKSGQMWALNTMLDDTYSEDLRKVFSENIDRSGA